MTDAKTRIAAGLERAFAEHGFAQPSVEDLRQAANVSLRTLYKYTPSRDAMTLAALEHRHRRYVEHVFGHSDNAGEQSLDITLDRIADWMRSEASHGCLFHAAVAAAPEDQDLRDLLSRHKSEISALAVANAGLSDREGDVLLIIEGLTQTWPISKENALVSAKRLAHAVQENKL